MRGNHHGGSKGSPEPVCVIQEGDVITQIRLRTIEGTFLHRSGHRRSNSFIQRLEFTTRDSTVCDFCRLGCNSSDSFTVTLSHPGYRLSHLSGHSGWYHGDNLVVNPLRFHWIRDKTLGGNLEANNLFSISLSFSR